MIIIRASKYGCDAYFRSNDGGEHVIDGFLAVRLPDNTSNNSVEIMMDANCVTYIKDDNNDKY